MRPVNFQTRLLGHALTVWAMAGVTLFSAYACAMNIDAWPLLAGALLAMGKVMDAHGKVVDHQNWQREWNGLSERPAARPRRGRPVLLVALVVGVAIYLGATSDQPGHLFALGWMVLLGLGLIGVMLVYGAWKLSARRRHHRAVRTKPVTICVTRPAINVPTLEAAYRALPDHCRQILNGGC